LYPVSGSRSSINTVLPALCCTVLCVALPELPQLIAKSEDGAWRSRRSPGLGRTGAGRFKGLPCATACSSRASATGLPSPAISRRCTGGCGSATAGGAAQRTRRGSQGGASFPPSLRPSPSPSPCACAECQCAGRGARSRPCQARPGCRGCRPLALLLLLLAGRPPAVDGRGGSEGRRRSQRRGRRGSARPTQAALPGSSPPLSRQCLLRRPPGKSGRGGRQKGKGSHGGVSGAHAEGDAGREAGQGHGWRPRRETVQGVPGGCPGSSLGALLRWHGRRGVDGDPGA